MTRLAVDRRWRTLTPLALGIVVLAWSPGLAAQEVAVAPLSSGDIEQLWVASSDRIVNGEFSAARQMLGRIVDGGTQDPHFQQVAGWLDRLQGMTVTKVDLERQQRDQYLELAHRAIKKSKWDEGLAYARRASEAAPLANEFMREPWVQELHDQAVTEAARLRDAGEWADASGLYYELKSLYEGNREYESQMDACLARSRMQVMYDDSEDWHRRLNGITQRMAEAALERVDQQYVSMAPDFKAITRSGLERLSVLAQTKALIDQFPGLADDAKRNDFVNRIERTLTRLDRREEVTYRHAIEYLHTAIKINEQTIDLEPEIVLFEYVEAGLQELDPFTSMIWPEEFAEFEKHTQGHFKGVGIQITISENKLTVVSPLEDTPAYRAGIETDDVITHIDGESTEGVTTSEAVRRITGPIKTEVLLTIYRPRTNQTFEVPLIRDKIQIQTVRGWQREGSDQHWDYFIDPEFKIGYVRMTNFAEQTANDLRQAMQDIDNKGGQALILDLRFNPGGLLRSAVEVCELFLPRDLKIVSTEGARSEPSVRFSRTRGWYYDKPVIVLVNEQSASASEIVSGALKDHHRATIVGERTFGKGSVQNLIPVSGPSAHLKLTTAYYYLPSGQLIHKVPAADDWGVEPDVEVVLTPSEQFKVASMRRDADVIHGGEAGKVAGREITTPKKQSPTPAPADGDAAATVPVEGAGSPQDSVTAPDGGAAPDVDAVVTVEDDEPLPEPIKLPDIDHQLEAAKLILRVQLIRNHGFGILPKVSVAAPGGSADVATN